MKITFGDVLKTPILAGAKLIAGKSGLDSCVESISVLEVADSTVTKFILPNQIAITAFYSALNNVDEQLAIVRMLHSKQCPGILLSHVEMFLKDISPKLVSLCDELNIPLVIAPSNASYFEMISDVLDLLVGSKNKELTDAMKIYDKMTHLLLDSQDFGTIITEVSRLIERKSVLFFDYNHQCIANSGSTLSDEDMRYLEDQIEQHAGSFAHAHERAYIREPNSDRNILLLPVNSKSTYYGILVVYNADELTELERIALAQARNTLGITALNRINLREYQSKLRNDFVRDLLYWNFADEQAARTRATSLNVDLSRARAVLLLDLFRFRDYSKGEDEIKIERKKALFLDTVQEEMQYLAPESLLFRFSDKIALIYIGDSVDNCALKQLGELLQSAVKTKLGVPMSIGIGRTISKPEAIATSYVDAMNTVRIANRIYKEATCISCDDIPVFLLAAGSTDTVQLKRVTDKLLAPIIEYDREHNSNLQETLEILVTNGWDTTVAANQLFVHKNTILQRKKKIESLFEKGPFSKSAKMQYELAYILKAIVSDA